MKIEKRRGSKYVARRLDRLREERRRAARQRIAAVGYIGPGDDPAEAEVAIREYCAQRDLDLSGIVSEMLGSDSIVPTFRPEFAVISQACRSGRFGAVVVFRAGSLGSRAAQAAAVLALGPFIGLSAASGRAIDAPGLLRGLARAAAAARPARRPRFGGSKKPDAGPHPALMN